MGDPSQKVRIRMNLTQKLGIAAIGVSLPAIVISGSGLLQGATANQAPNAAEWLSAISTFWGAIGTAFGALLTGGAVIYAARTYEKQREDRHAELLERRRAQASAVTLSITNNNGSQWCKVRNDSALPIFAMNVVEEDASLTDPVRHYLQPILSSNRPFEQVLNDASVEELTFVEFKDAAGVEWKRYGDGRLIEEKLSEGNRRG